MKTRLITLFLLIFSTVSAQEPFIVKTSGRLILYKIDTVNNVARFAEAKRLQGENSITIEQPVYIYERTGCYGCPLVERVSFSPYENHNYVITSEGYYFDNFIAIDNSNDFFKWFNSFKKEYPKKEKVITEMPEQTPFEQEQDRLQASMRASSRARANHPFLTIFTGDLEFNFSYLQVTYFLEKYKRMVEKSNNNDGKNIVVKYSERTSTGNPQTLTFKYKVRVENGYYFPTQVEITGTKISVIDFFVTYYPTTINIDERKPGEFVSYMLPDKITLKIDKNGIAKIIITKNN